MPAWRTSLPKTVPPGANPVAALTRYLTEGKTESARRLAEKAVVIIDPPALRGTIVWP